MGSSEGSKKRGRTEITKGQTSNDRDEGQTAGVEARVQEDGILSKQQIAKFLRLRPKTSKSITNPELREYLNDCGFTEVAKKDFKATLKAAIAARIDKQPAKKGKQEELPEDFLKGDWLCPQCNNHNYASRAECYKCHTCRPRKPSTGKEMTVGGDNWVCPSCENSNFATRKKCNKCQMAKPDDKPSETKGSSNEGRSGVWNAKLMLSREQIEAYVNGRDHAKGKLTREELIQHMETDLAMDVHLSPKAHFDSTLRAAVEASRKRHKRIKRGREELTAK
ncbi:hypothetical protein CYMTET_50128 [Cymbomonas tetramitiformis]|uniref:RanBP2-type domain-containing protein n=1 Tax=Cymbomonas tetramitiformis TaxID=36881 RepID=A0AAE0BPZ3_9CHLO|nr:hypothetical protein CYMTET_50128 [Cymbomonas tetramitiformis]